MLSIYTIAPLFFLLGSSYLFNNHKLGESKSHVLMVSAFEGCISYLIIYLIFLEGFVSKFYQYFLLVLLVIIISYVFFLIEKRLDDQIDLQIETIKNNLILYAITFAPFYIFLTVFRFEPIILQLVYSFIGTGVIIAVYTLFRDPINTLTENVFMFIADSDAKIFLGLWAIVVFLILLITLIDLPINKARENMNLSDNVSYFNYDGFPTTLKNNHQKIVSFQFEIENNFDDGYSNYIDYFIDDNLLYIYSDSDLLTIVDINKEEVVSQFILGQSSEDSGLNFNEITNLFFKQGEHTYLLAKTGIYKLNEDSFTLISPLKAPRAKLFYKNETPSILINNTNGFYSVFNVQDEELMLVDEIHLPEDTSDTLKVISHTLFRQSDTHYTEQYDHSQSFKIEHGAPIYDNESNAMYYASFLEEPQTSGDTKYYKVSSKDSSQMLTFPKLHNTYGIVVNSDVYYVEKPENSIGRIEIFSQEFKVNSVLNHRTNTRIWVANQYNRSSIVNYLEYEGALTYLQTEESRDKILFTLNAITNEETGVSTPFYSHYGLFSFLPVIIFLFVPMSNYRTEITFIGFDQIRKKKS